MRSSHRPLAAISQGSPYSGTSQAFGRPLLCKDLRIFRVRSSVNLSTYYKTKLNQRAMSTKGRGGAFRRSTLDRVPGANHAASKLSSKARIRQHFL